MEVVAEYVLIVKVLVTMDTVFISEAPVNHAQQFVLLMVEFMEYILIPVARSRIC